jgi:hypothetical protein
MLTLLPTYGQYRLLSLGRPLYPNFFPTLFAIHFHLTTSGTNPIILSALILRQHLLMSR